MQVTRALKSHLNFGRLMKQYGEYRFALAPSEQDPWKGYFKSVFVNVFKEYVWRTWYVFLPPVTGLYLLYDWSLKANYQANRKDPKEFENDT